MSQLIREAILEVITIYQNKANRGLHGAEEVFEEVIDSLEDTLQTTIKHAVSIQVEARENRFIQDYKTLMENKDNELIHIKSTIAVYDDETKRLEDRNKRLHEEIGKKDKLIAKTTKELNRSPINHEYVARLEDEVQFLRSLALSNVQNGSSVYIK